MATRKKVALTKARIDAIRPPVSGRTYVYDEHAPGLCVAVTSRGTRTFYSYRKVQGRPVRVRLGRVGELALDEARRLAIKMIGKIAAGENPQAERQAARHAITLSEVFDRYLSQHCQFHNKERTVKDYKWIFGKYLARWKGRRPGDITKAEAQALHIHIAQDSGPVVANRVRGLLSAMFEFAIRDLDFRKPNPIRGVRKFREQSRDRFLQADELPRFFAALDEEENPTAKAFFLLAIYTGARKTNLLTMRWQDIDIAAGTWRIPDTKAGEPQTVVLPAEALEILASRARNDSEWVFPGHVRGTPLRDPYKWWRSILARAGITNLRIHDLRRTLGSWQAATGASLSVIGKSLGHRRPETTAVYARLNLDPVRQAVGRATAAIAAAARPGVRASRFE